MSARIGIVGGGASGVLVAVQLLRQAHTPIDVLLFEPRERLGEGIAYSTTDDAHLLNVRAANMSGLPDVPDSFRAWMKAEPVDYLKRKDYAKYLRWLLQEAESVNRIPVTHIRQRVTDITRIPGSARSFNVRASDGRLWELDDVVIATGNVPPKLPAGIHVSDSVEDSIVSNPWDPQQLARLASAREVVVIGSGLTAVDVAVSILSRHTETRVVCLSRHGLLPQSHEAPWQPPFAASPIAPLELAEGLTLVQALRRLRTECPQWRRSLDALRPVTRGLWLALKPSQRSQFMRHLERFWEVHRHRMAPQIAHDIDHWIQDGRLEVHAAPVSAIEDGPVVVAADGRRWSGDHVVVATGPGATVAGNSVFERMADHGLVRPGPGGVGLDVDPMTSQALDAHGKRVHGLYVIGAPAKGVFYECIAIPDLRDFAALIASEIASESLLAA